MRYQIDGVYGEVDSLPGCSQVAVSHSVFVPPELRGRGRGTGANGKRLLMLKEELGYNYVMCTVDASNVPQRMILDINGWKKLDEFKSSKTGHTVFLFGKQL